MQTLLNHPAVQAAAVPFVVALVLAFALARTRALAVAVASGLVVELALTVGFALEPLTAMRKMVVVTLAATAIAVVLEAAGVAQRRGITVVLAGVTALAAAWVLQRVLAQKEPAAAVWMGTGAVAFVFAVVGSSLQAATASPLRASVVAACLGWGTGVLALFGASALLAQLGLALGTAGAAVALVQMIRGQESPLGWTLALPAAVGAALVALLASATGELPWYCLLPLPLVPWAARLVRAPSGALWRNGFGAGCAALVPVLLAVGVAWFAARQPSPAG